MTWWRHQRETFSALLALWAGNSPVTGEFPHKGQCRRALMFSLIWAWKNGWANNRDADDLRHHHAHYDVTVMISVYRNNIHICIVVFSIVVVVTFLCKFILCCIKQTTKCWLFRKIRNPILDLFALVLYFRMTVVKQLENCGLATRLTNYSGGNRHIQLYIFCRRKYLRFSFPIEQLSTCYFDTRSSGGLSCDEVPVQILE